jgi:hypothetical protein
MSLDTYANLKAAVLEWQDSPSGLSTNLGDAITLAEGRLNRELGPVETNATLAGVVDSRALNVSALSIVEPIALFIADASSEDESLLQQQAPAAMAYADTSGRPSQWTMDTTTSIKLDRPCDQTYAFRFRYRERFALSDSVTTNWLLANHPDIYFAAVMMWGHAYQIDGQHSAAWDALLSREIPKLKRTIAQQHRGTLRLDPALARVGRRTGFNYATGF